ncbi:MAG TPA: hypothetical protein VLW54_13200 [Candidatus Acidoferrales bacterium]|nr:hypothetical protein [Candidatus Acidoferrales bacterium]
MNDSERREIEGSVEEASRGSAVRKPYRKPTYRFEQVFETMALQCGKIGATSSACSSNKMVS